LYCGRNPADLYILAEEYAEEDQDACRVLQKREAIAEDDPAQDHGEDRDEVDKGAGLAGRDAADAEVVEAIGPQGHEDSEVDDAHARHRLERARNAAWMEEDEGQEEEAADKRLEGREGERGVAGAQVLQTDGIARGAHHG